MYFGAALLRGVSLLEFVLWFTFRVALFPNVVVTPYLEIELMGERVYAAHVYTVQSIGHFVIRGIELSACMQCGEHDFCGGDLLAIHHHVVNRNTAAVINNCD